MLSKSKGQILRVLAAFHCLFNINGHSETPELKDEISEEAVTAAINFVELCCQQTAFMAGHGNILDEIQLIKASMCTECNGVGTFVKPCVKQKLFQHRHFR